MKARREMVRMGTKIGATLGGIAFLIFGLIPGSILGAMGRWWCLSTLWAGPVEATVLVRMVVAVGILLGIVCIASVSIVVGSILGTGLGYLVEAVTSPVEVKEAAEAVAKAK